MLNGGCWIFLSHHSQDIEKVRVIRNEFERLGHNPLAFHLKCLTTDSESGRIELDNLIKREIDAREWFVFCENPLITSEWVDMEQNYIIEQGKDMVWSIDMNLEEGQIIEQVRRICKEIEVFISYSRIDKAVADIVTKLLIGKDYSVWTPESMVLCGQNLKNEIEVAVNRCSYEGFYIMLLTKNSFHSEWIEHELELALSHGRKERIIFVLIGDERISKRYENYQCYILPENPCEDDFTPILKYMEKQLKLRISRNI